MGSRVPVRGVVSGAQEAGARGVNPATAGDGAGDGADATLSPAGIRRLSRKLATALVLVGVSDAEVGRGGTATLPSSLLVVVPRGVNIGVYPTDLMRGALARSVSGAAGIWESGVGNGKL
jgi:hypothetical protein